MATYQEGQRLQGSDGKTYRVVGGVPRLENAAPQASAPDAPAPQASAPGRTAPPANIPGRPRAPAQPTPPSQFTEETDARDYDFKVGEQAFDHANTLREKFNQFEPVKNYNTVIRYYGMASTAEDTTAGDQTLINSFAKMQNPDSTVMQGEFDSAAENDRQVQQVITRLKREFGWDGAGRLSPEARTWMLNEMQSIATNSNAAYRQAREYYGDLATRNGVDPFEVIGPHAGEPYKDSIYDRRLDVRQQEGGARAPTNRDTYANGVQFNIDAPEDPFDRSAYLQETYGIAPAQEDLIVGFWNAQRGNANLTAQAAREWYQGKGLSPPSEEDLAGMVDNAQKGYSFGGIDTRQAEEEYTGQLDQVLGQRGADPESTSGTIGVNTAQGVMMEGLDEAHGIGGFLGALVRGNDPVAGYQAERDLVRREVQRSETENPGTAFTSRLGGNALSGGFGFKNVATAGEALIPGAITGGIYGFNAGQGATNSLLGASIGVPTGAAAAAGAQGGINALANRFGRHVGPVTQEQLNVLAAGERMDVPIRQPDVRPEVRGQRGVTLNTERGGPIIRETETADREAFQGAVERNLGGNGNPHPTRESMGDAAQDALDNVRTASGKRIGALYTRAHNAASGVRITPTKAIAAIDQQIAELQAAGPKANKGQIEYLTDIRDDLSRDGGLTIAALRDQRTGMRGQINERNLTHSDAERRVGLVLDAAAEDINAGLAGMPQVRSQFQRADQEWSTRQQFVRQIMEKVTGPENNRRSGSAAATTLENWIRGDFKRLRRLWTELDPSDREAIQATVVDSLGKNGKGEFSLNTFLSNVSGRRATISPPVARLMFGDDGARALDDLRTIAQAKVAAASETNNSRTGQTVQSVGRGLRTLLLTWMGFTAGDVTGAVVAPAASSFISRFGERRAARLLMNPDFTGWLKSLPNATNPQAINRQFARLDSIAARSPTMAADISGFRQALMSFANDNGAVASAAAEPQGANGDGERAR